MSLNQVEKKITPPSNLVEGALLTPPPTNEKGPDSWFEASEAVAVSSSASAATALSTAEADLSTTSKETTAASEPSSTVKAVLKLFESRQRGTGFEVSPWTEFKLAEGEYAVLEARLRKEKDLFDFVQNKLRFTCPGRSNAHHYAREWGYRFHRSNLVTASEFRDAEQESEIRDFARQISMSRSTTVKPSSIESKPGNVSQHDPDNSWKHFHAKFPGVVLEVSYSQNGRMLEMLADDYILGSQGCIQVVIGLDLEYRSPNTGKAPSHRAAYSVWRASSVETEHRTELHVIREIDKEPLCHDDGTPSDFEIRLQLSDFAYPPINQYIRGENDPQIVLNFKDIYQQLKHLTESERSITYPILPSMSYCLGKRAAEVRLEREQPKYMAKTQ